MGGLNNKYLFFTVLGAGKSQITALAIPVSGEARFLARPSPGALSMTPDTWWYQASSPTLSSSITVSPPSSITPSSASHERKQNLKEVKWLGYRKTLRWRSCAGSAAVNKKCLCVNSLQGYTCLGLHPLRGLSLLKRLLCLIMKCKTVEKTLGLESEFFFLFCLFID